MKKEPELGYPMTDYGNKRLLAGLAVGFGSSHSNLEIRILPEGDVELSYPYAATLFIPKRLRQSIADALLLLPDGVATDGTTEGAGR